MEVNSRGAVTSFTGIRGVPRIQSELVRKPRCSFPIRIVSTSPAQISLIKTAHAETNIE